MESNTNRFRRFLRESNTSHNEAQENALIIATIRSMRTPDTAINMMNYIYELTGREATFNIPANHPIRQAGIFENLDLLDTNQLNEVLDAFNGVDFEDFLLMVSATLQYSCFAAQTKISDNVMMKGIKEELKDVFKNDPVRNSEEIITSVLGAMTGTMASRIDFAITNEPNCKRYICEVGERPSDAARADKANSTDRTYWGIKDEDDVDRVYADVVRVAPLFNVSVPPSKEEMTETHMMCKILDQKGRSPEDTVVLDTPNWMSERVKSDRPDTFGTATFKVGKYYEEITGVNIENKLRSSGKELTLDAYQEELRTAIAAMVPEQRNLLIDRINNTDHISNGQYGLVQKRQIEVVANKIGLPECQITVCGTNPEIIGVASIAASNYNLTRIKLLKLRSRMGVLLETQLNGNGLKSSLEEGGFDEYVSRVNLYETTIRPSQETRLGEDLEVIGQAMAEFNMDSRRALLAGQNHPGR